MIRALFSNLAFSESATINKLVFLFSYYFYL